MPEEKDKIDDLEHEILEQKLKGVRGQLMSLGDTLHQRMDSIDKQNRTEFDYIRESLKEIGDTGKQTLKQATTTNSRVTKLEVNVENIGSKVDDDIPKEIETLKKHTRVVRFMHRYPVVTTLLVTSLYLFSIDEVRKPVLSAIENLLIIIRLVKV